MWVTQVTDHLGGLRQESKQNAWQQGARPTLPVLQEAGGAMGSGQNVTACPGSSWTDHGVSVLGAGGWGWLGNEHFFKEESVYFFNGR